MSERDQRFAVLTWSDLIKSLESMQQERAMLAAGMTFSEVTDLVQAQLFRDQPLLALRAARVIEIRSVDPEVVLYLRTGIPVGTELATLEAGPFLPAIRTLDNEDGECRFVRHSRVKRGDNWRQNLRRRLRESLRGLPTETVTYSLVDIMTAQSDDLEADLTVSQPARSTNSIPTTSPATGSDQSAVFRTADWGEIQAAGISLPVWMSAITSLALVLILLLNSP
jgi:hypothetical protein